MEKLSSPLQLTQRVIVNVPIEKMWTVFNDLSARPKWTGDVQSIEFKNQHTTVGETAVTSCIVNGKHGTIHTKCLSLSKNKRCEFLIEKDTFGLTKMLHGMGFAAEFNSIGANKTEFVMLSHYQLKNLILKLMNGIIKRKMGKEVDLMLEGLKNFTETGQVNLLNPINN